MIHQLRVGEPSAGADLLVLGSGGLRDATGTGLDGIRTFLNPSAPDLIDLVGMNKTGKHQGCLCMRYGPRGQTLDIRHTLDRYDMTCGPLT